MTRYISAQERRKLEDEALRKGLYDLPKPKKILVPPTDEEVFHMLQVARDQYGVAYGHKNWDLLKRMRHGRIMMLRILVFLFTWCRVSEAVMLRRSDFNFENRTVEIYRAYVVPKRRKGEAIDQALPLESPVKPPKRGSARTLPLAKVACDIFDNLFKETRLKPEDFVLSGSQHYIKPWEVRDSLKIIARASNVDPQKVYPHAFRQKGATLLKRYGYSLTAMILGHHDRGLTVLKSYERPFESEKIQAVEKVTDSLAAGLAADMGLTADMDKLQGKGPEQEGDKGSDAAAPEGDEAQ